MGTRAWTALVIGIAGYEAYCIRSERQDELLSRVLDRARAKHPVANVAILATIAATSLHLARAVPSRFDVFALLHIA
ncbi:hypothetical protein WKY82_09150 [Gordonia malaquae]|uniref:DUF7427 family protein n=1 Tax=Gordonia malaquae TaxID=410332 RepID=UPI0030C793E1